jgi:hypothetical protein
LSLGGLARLVIHPTSTDLSPISYDLSPIN